MKKTQEEKIEMLRVENRRGATLLKHQYELISGLILSTLDTHPKNEIALSQLLDVAHEKLDPHQFQGDVSWYLLQVKQDLEARRLIKISLTRSREQLIHL